MTEEKDRKKYQKEIKKRKKKKGFLFYLWHFLKKLFTILWYMIGTIIIVCGILFCVCYFKFYPTYQEYRNQAIEYVSNSTTSTFTKNLSGYIYDDSGKLISKLSIDSNSDYIKYEDIPKDVVNAFIAVEDRTFWEHSGFDLNGIIRVGYRFVITGGKEKHGASTITQQLARNTFLTNEVSLKRKVKEILISVELEKKYSKEEIMEFYVNGAYFANRCYGIEAASTRYFNKSVKELNLSEIAYLCSIPNSPSYYDPIKHPENAISRRDKILNDMYECGYITNKELKEALDYEVVLNPSVTEKIQNYETTYAIDCAVKYLMKLNGFEFKYKFADTAEYNTYMDSYNEAYDNYRDELYTGGYKVKTSLNAEKQTLLQNSIDEVMSFNKDVSDDGTYSLQSAATIIDNKTHKVVAIVGGRSQDNIDTYTLNRAYQSYRQPGSTFKPIAVYAPALDNGYTPDSILQNISIKEAKKKKVDARTLTGSEVTLRKAVEKSINGCAWWLFCNLTPQKGLSYVNDMEFAKIVPDDYYPASSLGGLTHGTTTVEMANAYSTLANNGVFHSATCLTSLIDKDGNELYAIDNGKQVYSGGAASEMVDIMKGVIKYGTAHAMNWKSKVEVAGKTGTTNDSKDGWFCGMIPDYTMSVWVGYDNPKTLSNLYGATYPMKIWKPVMEKLAEESTDTKFTVSTDKEATLNALGAQAYETYLPGRDDDEVLSNNYTVRNYREDHIIADNAEAIMYELDNLNEYDSDYFNKGNELYNEAKALVDTIYSRKLYATESEKLESTYNKFLSKMQ